MSLCNFRRIRKRCCLGQKEVFVGFADSFVDVPPSLPFAGLS